MKNPLQQQLKLLKMFQIFNCHTILTKTLSDKLHVQIACGRVF